jgi:glycosyltransferase involved in cell wall biosynthesis
MLKEKSIPWVLMDRSPPADTGILARLHWPMWKKSWKLVKNNNAHSGCVVSSAHSHFVHSRTGTLLENMVILPAGVDVSLFKPGIKDDTLTLIYHGRLDRHRAILSLPILLEKLRQHDIKAKLLLIGEGDAFEGLVRMAKNLPNMEVIAALPSPEVAAKLARSHIGLLPMPKMKVWSLASPLKRSEYAASGLLIFGIDHMGHRLKEKVHPPWIHLVDQENFYRDGVKWIQSLTPENIQSLSQESRDYAVQNLKWVSSVEKLEQTCLSSLI